MTAIRQSSFAKGEVSPDVYGRTDQSFYRIALRQLRNFNNQRFGGVQNRPGSQFISRVKNSAAGQVRLIPFVFSQTLAFMLEFGNQYVRFIKNGAQVLEAAVAITAISQANQGVVTAAGHGYSTGDEVVLSAISGMTQLNGRNCKVTVVDANNFQISDLDGIPLSTLAFSAYTSGGVAQRVYQISSPFATADLQGLNYAQSANEMTIVHQNYPPQTLVRTTDTSWTLSTISFSPNSPRPSGTVAAGALGGGEILRYRVTEVSGTGGEESLPGFETAKNITGATAANPVVVTCTAHGYQTGDEVYITGVGGMVQLNVNTYIITVVDANNFALQGVNGTAYTAYTSGGTAARTYFRVDNANEPSPSAPAVLTITYAHSVPASPSDVIPQSFNIYREKNGVYGYIGNALLATGTTTIEAGKAITGATQANPGVITVVAHGYNTGDVVLINSVGGMVQLNGKQWVVNKLTADTFSLTLGGVAIDTTSFGAYTSGGLAYKVDPATNLNTVFSDIGTLPDTNVTPPIDQGLFKSAGNYPGVVCYYQQRKMFANTINNPATVYGSQPGRYNNFTVHFPLVADDALSFTLVGNNEVNPILGMVDLRRLLLFTAAGEWQVVGNVSGALTATDPPNATQTSTNGSTSLRPLVVSASAVYAMAQCSMVRDLIYDFTSDNYSGVELSVDSSHLIDGHNLVDWAFEKAPRSIIWAVRDDGQVLALTYIREQQMIAWSHHDWLGQVVFPGGGQTAIALTGTVESIAAIPEGSDGSARTAIYLVVNRQLGRSSSVRYIERLSSRTFSDLRFANFMDGSLTFDGTNYDTTKTMYFSGGTLYDSTEHLTLNCPSGFFTSAMVGDAIFIYTTTPGTGKQQLVKFSIDTYVSATQVQGIAYNVAVGASIPSQLTSGGSAVWARAVKKLAGFWHLAGNAVSILGDGNVVANPFNQLYPTIYTVALDGTITLDNWYAVVTAGLPITSDMQTLDIDTPQSESLMGKKVVVTSISAYLREARGLFFGQKAPPADAYGSTDTSQANLESLRPRAGDTPDAPGELLTDPYTLPIQGSWTRGGRVFIRQTDPLPATILAVAANGNFPFRPEGS